MDVLAELTRADLRARYGRGSWLVFKWLLDPFAVVGVYLILVTVLLNRDEPAAGLSLACAVVPFQLLMMTVINGLNAVEIRRSIIANMPFPRILIPIASAMTESVAFGASLLLLAGMMLVYGVPPTAAVVWFPLVLATNVVLATASAYPASLAGIWIRDLQPFVVSFVRTMFFLAPGLITLQQITGTANQLVRLNPLTGLFDAYRTVLVEGRAPAAWHFLYPLSAALVIAAAFVPIYRREQAHFAEVVE